MRTRLGLYVVPSSRGQAHVEAAHPGEVLDLVAADLFQDRNVTSIERLFRKARGQTEDNSHSFKEVIVFSDNLLHVFVRSKKKKDQAAVSAS